MTKKKVVEKKAEDTKVAEVEKPALVKIKQPANLTQEDAAIFERIKTEGQDREWERVTEEDAHDFTLAQDPMKLPEFAEKLLNEKEYAFRWIERRKERVDEIRSMPVPQKWWIVNASTMPDSVSELDSVLGCVCRYDQLLVFKPYWMYVKEKKMEELRSEEKASAGELKSKHHAQVDDSGSEFLSGKEARIGGSDAVQYHETDPDKAEDSDTAVVGEATAFEEGDDGLGELEAEE